MDSSISLTVTGKVQGVFFRKYTQDKARELELRGFVRNQPDGSVYAEATGNEHNVAAFVEWCHEGSPMSEVAAVKVNSIIVKHMNTFSITHI